MKSKRHGKNSFKILSYRHGTSRILFRNTRQGVKGFPHRVYHQITIDAAEVDEKIHWLIDFLKYTEMKKS